MKINRRQFVATTATGLLIPSVYAAPSDTATNRELTGKTICGYQGWFNTPGDGMGLGYRHYDFAGRGFKPGHCTIDYWPDMSEIDPKECYDTPFKHKDGRTAQVFSSADTKTIIRHHQWMKEYGIHGVALQRFGNGLKNKKLHRMYSKVMASTRQAAKHNNRLWMNMYDLSGLKRGQPQQYVADDWEKLVNDQRITEDKTYITHHGKPLVSIWGVGFSDNRDYTLSDCAELIDRVSMGGRFSIMLGIPYHWRKRHRDAVPDQAFHDLLAKADIISPWSVTRLQSIKDVTGKGASLLEDDFAWCREHSNTLLPVACPGFSVRNLKHAKGEEGSSTFIPRQDGAFLWAQAEVARKAGAKSLYIAMFDEMDEGTAILKCTNDPPVGDSSFQTYEGLPSDHYLWLTGRIAERLRQGAKPPIAERPKR